MKQFLLVFQIIIAIILIISILLQVKSGGFARSWGSSSFSRRGLEKIVFNSTFVLAALFVILSVLQLFI